MNQAKLVCIWESGECWAGQVAGEDDLLLYCQDGVLACSQVQHLVPWGGGQEDDLLLYCQDGVLACSQVPTTLSAGGGGG